jgi:hypothetical protein
MDRFLVLVFVGGAATIVDLEPLLCDGCTSVDDAQQWAVEKHAAGRAVDNVVHLPSDAKAKAYVARFGYTPD